MDVKAWLLKTTRDLEAAGVDSPRLDALVLLEHVSGVDRTKLLASKTVDVDEKKLNKFIGRRLNREPVAYIVGYKEFYGRKFYVDQNVLIPRPESETIVEYVAKHAPNEATCIDIGTGSGALGLSIKLERQDIDVTVSDVSEKALKVAKKNSKDLEAKTKFVLSDLLNDVQGKFDVIVANLPYVPPGGRSQEELAYEPHVAIYSRNDGLELYRKLSSQLDRLKTGGFLIVEHDITQIEAIKKVFPKAKAHSSVSHFVSVFSF